MIQPGRVAALAEADEGVGRDLGLLAVDGHDFDREPLQPRIEREPAVAATRGDHRGLEIVSGRHPEVTAVLDGGDEQGGVALVLKDGNEDGRVDDDHTGRPFSS